MPKIGVADYGMHVWFGGMYDYETRMEELKGIGYDGVERLYAKNGDEVMRKLTCLQRLGMSFGTCETGDIELNIKWTAALGKRYIWANKSIFIPEDIEAYCRNTRYLCKACADYGIRASVHNHLGSMVETQEQLDMFLEMCPDAGLILDTGHLGGAGGDVLATVQRYYDRITAVHLKDWYVTDSGAEQWNKRGYFCALGKGNVPIDNEGVVRYLISRGYDQWIFIEQDTHHRDPFVDLAECRNVLEGWL